VLDPPRPVNEAGTAAEAADYVEIEASNGSARKLPIVQPEGRLGLRISIVCRQGCQTSGLSSALLNRGREDLSLIASTLPNT
jgi:hypothetical protein